MKWCVVTGASLGIGREVAKGLARSGRHVIMVSRDPVRSAAAAEEVRAVAAPGVEVAAVVADLSSLAAVRAAAAAVKKKTQALDVLVNCAALVPKTRTVTPEGFEAAFAVNVLAPLVLVQELKGLLSAGAPSRVVNFFGGMEKSVDFDDLQAEKGSFDGLKQYGHTKVALALLSIEMARRLVPVDVSVNVAFPGVVNTEGARALGGFMGFVTLLTRPFAKTPEEGALTALWLATAPELERVSGKFFGAMRGDPRQEYPLPAAARDLEGAKRVYEACERLVATS